MFVTIDDQFSLVRVKFQLHTIYPFLNRKKLYEQHIHKFLTVDTVVRVTKAMVSSQLSYCKSLIYGSARPVLLNFRKFKMLSVALFSDWTKLVMSHPI